MTEAHWTPETVKGWRVWYTMRGTLRPHSITRTLFNWTVEPEPATCIRGKVTDPHLTPHPLCTCGYYSLKPELIEHPTLWDELVLPFELVVLCYTIGWVESWGTIEEYEFGYRSERARILSLVTLPHHHLDGVDTYNHRTLEAAERYGLPVVDIFDSVPA